MRLAAFVKNCEDCAILAQYRLDLGVGKFPQFFTLNDVPSISEAYRVQLQALIEDDKESQAKTQATLQQLRSLIETVQSIEFED